MHVTELYGLTNWIEVHIKAPNIVGHYQKLQAVLQQLAQAGQAAQPFEDETNTLKAALQGVNFDALTQDQLAFLDQLGIAQHVGRHAVDDLEDILFRQSLDIATAASKIQTKIESIATGISKSDQIHAGLEGYELPEAILENEVLIRVAFSGKAAIKNVSDLKSWSTAWFDIGRGITMIQGLTPQHVRMVGAKRGSVVFEFALLAAGAQIFIWIVHEALKVAERVMTIRVKSEELKGLKLSNEKLAVEVAKEAKKEQDNSVTRIVTEVLNRLDKAPNEDGDQVIALEKGVTKLVDFINKGGDVDFSVPEEVGGELAEGEEVEGQREKFRQLRLSTEEIRQLKHELKLLEHKPESVEE